MEHTQFSVHQGTEELIIINVTSKLEKQHLNYISKTYRIPVSSFKLSSFHDNVQIKQKNVFSRVVKLFPTYSFPLIPVLIS